MKLRFTQRHVIAGQTRADDLVYEKDQVVNFSGWVAETYAKKYVNDLQVAVEVDEAADRKASQDAARAEALRAKLEQRSAVDIPEKFADLPNNDLFALANKFSDDKVKDRPAAIATVQAEIDRRAAL